MRAETVINIKTADLDRWLAEATHQLGGVRPGSIRFECGLDSGDDGVAEVMMSAFVSMASDGKVNASMTIRLMQVAASGE